ncbi:hypothetical protein B1813_00110 [Saccharomonospora piscinae]|uniref:Excreted virulence factor EspC, type VII ESX diderm n=1 Tax=Saccharomonospora piscinae TaxID=687388 RepID=A0A1V9ABR2_SACPI|nr:hypothetical protein [Saccharomonospora piscinae]OQO94562.1 hypothetical protein B1813_00110 [Saccharomonospora piscinae]TLW94736.1 hypothetical protein FFT09_02345 [Saccharomonospora piscinae]
MGFRADPEALRQAAAGMESAAGSIDTGLAVDVTAPDAGASSAYVGSTILGLLSVGVALAETFDAISDRVHVAAGGYADIENTSEGELRYVAQYHLEHVQQGGDPLKDAPDRTTETAPDPEA